MIDQWMGESVFEYLSIKAYQEYDYHARDGP